MCPHIQKLPFSWERSESILCTSSRPYEGRIGKPWRLGALADLVRDGGATPSFGRCAFLPSCLLLGVEVFKLYLIL